MSEFLRKSRYLGLGLVMGFGAAACGSETAPKSADRPVASHTNEASKTGLTTKMQFFDDGSAIIFYDGQLQDKYLKDGEVETGYIPRTLHLHCEGPVLITETLTEGYNDGSAPSVIPNFDGCLDDGKLTARDFELQHR